MYNIYTVYIIYMWRVPLPRCLYKSLFCGTFREPFASFSGAMLTDVSAVLLSQNLSQTFRELLRNKADLLNVAANETKTHTHTHVIA